MDKVLKAITMIQKKFKEDKKWGGYIKCPQCGNKLSYSIAKSNKHIWGNCETTDCLKWMM